MSLRCCLRGQIQPSSTRQIDQPFHVSEVRQYNLLTDFKGKFLLYLILPNREVRRSGKLDKKVYLRDILPDILSDLSFQLLSAPQFRLCYHS